MDRTVDRKREAKAINDLRVLALDMIQNANSGHPGMALDVAPAVFCLFANHLNIDPSKPNWAARDRFVLSSGHVSALLYAVLHMAGYAISIDDLKAFRQCGSKTPGHPEYGHTPGIDATAGPLGQGLAQAVGMAAAEKHLSALYPLGEAYISHKTYVLVGDGCLEEGISQEAISLAGQLGLNNLIVIYDRNGSTLDAPTGASMSDDAELRFLASGWNVYHVKDGNDTAAIDKALGKAKKAKACPSLIVIDSVIGYGSPLEGSNKAHGSPLKAEDAAKTRERFGADYPAFEVPDDSISYIRTCIASRLKGYKAQKAEAKAAFLDGDPNAKLYLEGRHREVEAYLPAIPAEIPDEASRATSGKIVAALGQSMPFFFGGSADVASSVMTAIPGDPGFTRDTPQGKNVLYGIREFEMGSFINGVLLHGGLVSYGGCFLVFADYLKPAIRMAALEKLPAIYLFSHDSLAVGEDGPTHQPIEQLMMLRAIPGLDVIRPADARETYAVWRYALRTKDHPVAIILSRQKLPAIATSSEEGFLKGAYLVKGPKTKPALQIIATGSEVSLALAVAEELSKQKISADVISLPSWEIFESQDEKYKASLFRLPKEKRVSLEMGATLGWQKYADTNIGVDAYGASGKEKDVLKAYGFTAEAVAEKIVGALGLKKPSKKG